MSLVGLVVVFLLALVLFNTSFGIINLIIALIAWGIAGYVAGQLVLKRDFGALGNVAIGLVGGVVGNFLVRALGIWGLGSVPLIGGILVGILGAVVILVVVGLVTGSRR